MCERLSSRLARGRLIPALLISMLWWGISPHSLAERPSAPRLLPSSTVALITVIDVPEMAARFQNTAMGRMSEDPQLKPLVGTFYGALTQALVEVEERIGLSLPQLLAIPQGEVTAALVAQEQGPPAVVVLLDAGDQLPNVQKLIDRAREALERTNASRREETVAGTKFVIYDGVGPRRRTVAYFEKDATIVAGSSVEVLKQLLSVWNGGQGETLSNHPSFGAVMQRCRGSQGETPHIAWYADPIGIVRAVGSGNAQVRVGLALLPALGLDGLSAAGGSMIFDTAQFDSVMHAHVLLESPRSGIIKMIALEPGDVEPEPWVPPDVASYTTVHWNIEKTYTTLANLYDSFREEGAFSRELQRRILGPTGIDIGKEIVPSLNGRITMLSWFPRPATLPGQAMLFGLGLKDPEPVDKALKKVIELSQGRMVERSYAGKTYYQLDDTTFRDRPPEQRPPLPCVGILENTLLIGNNAELFQKAILTLSEGSESLADELDFKLIASKIRRHAGATKPAMISFERPEKSLQFFYELLNSERIRSQLAEQAQNNPLFKSLQTALDEHPLPPFAVLQRYLAPGGSMLIDDETGIHYTAFGLRRQTD